MRKIDLANYFFEFGGTLTQQSDGWTVSWPSTTMQPISGRTLREVWKRWKAWVEDETLEQSLINIVVNYYKGASPEDMRDIQYWYQGKMYRLPKPVQDSVDFEMSYAFAKCLNYHWKAQANTAVTNVASFPAGRSLRSRIGIAIVDVDRRKLSAAIPAANHVDTVRQARL